MPSKSDPSPQSLLNNAPVGGPQRQSPDQLKLLVTDWTKSYQLYKHPHAIWLSKDEAVGANRALLAQTLAKAEARKQNPEIVIYSIPLRDLGQSSDGGFKNYDDYLKDNAVNAGMIAEFYKKTGLSPRVYIEPDALSLAYQYREENHYNEESVAIYRQRVQAFPQVIKMYRNAGALVYLEGAHSDWFDYSDAQVDAIAKTLNDARIDLADGIVTNVSNRQSVDVGERNEAHYLSRLLPRLNKKDLDIIVDTSRNGGPTKPRQYWLSPQGYLIDNEIPTGRMVGYWEQDAEGHATLKPFFGKSKSLTQLIKKEKYTFNLKQSILTAPKWLDPIGDVQPGPAPSDTVASKPVKRLRYVKPPDDCDGAVNCPPGQSKSLIIQETAKKQPIKGVHIPPTFWL